jgi:hypothetical protein
VLIALLHILAHLRVDIALALAIAAGTRLSPSSCGGLLNAATAAILIFAVLVRFPVLLHAFLRLPTHR